jgi:hypothetical protein
MELPHCILILIPIENPVEFLPTSFDTYVPHFYSARFESSHSLKDMVRGPGYSLSAARLAEPPRINVLALPCIEFW